MTKQDTGQISAQIFVLDIDMVEIGDIILTSEAQLRSKAIRTFTRSDYSHAMICVGKSSYVHAVGSGVEIANPQRDQYDHPDRVRVLRYTGEDRQTVAQEAANFARKKVGTQYSVPEAVATKLRAARKNLSNRQFCSRLVAQSYAHAGVNLVADPDYCSPQELAESSSLSAVPDSTIPADATALALIAEGNAALDSQAAVFSGLLKSARLITGMDLQTLDQIEKHLREDGTHDEALSDALESSGYLTIWKRDVEKNPWRYNADALLRTGLPEEEIRACAEREVGLAEEDVMRFAQAAEAKKESLRSADRRYFRIELALYEHLARLHATRYRAAKEVLRRLGDERIDSSEQP